MSSLSPLPCRSAPFALTKLKVFDAQAEIGVAVFGRSCAVEGCRSQQHTHVLEFLNAMHWFKHGGRHEGVPGLGR